MKKSQVFGLTVFESNEFLTTGQRNYERCLHLLRSFPRSLSCYFICYGGQIGHKNLHCLLPFSTPINQNQILPFSITISFQQTRFNTLVESSDRSRCTSIRKTFVLHTYPLVWRKENVCNTSNNSTLPSKKDAPEARIIWWWSSYRRTQ